MGKNKKGVELPVNLIIILVIGLFVFGAAYFGFLKPTQEGSSIFGKQMDAFKDQKFSLMDNFDSMTNEEKQNAGRENPQAIVESTINLAESLIPDDCGASQEILDSLSQGRVSGFNMEFEITVANKVRINSLIEKAQTCINTIDKIREEQKHEDKIIGMGIANNYNYKEIYPEIMDSYSQLVAVYSLDPGRDSCGDELNLLIEKSQSKINELLTINRNEKANVESSSLSEIESDHINNILEQSRYFDYYCESLKRDCSAANKVYTGIYRDEHSPEQSFEDHGDSSLPSELVGEKIETVYHITTADCFNKENNHVSSWAALINAYQSDITSNYFNSKKIEYLNLLFYPKNIFSYLSVDEMETIYLSKGKDYVVKNNLVGCPKDGIEQSEKMSECHNYNEKLVLKFLGPEGINEVSSLDLAVKKTLIPQEYKNNFLCYFDSNWGDECSSCNSIHECSDYPTGGSEWIEVCSADPCHVGRNGCFADDGWLDDECLGR